MVSSKMAWLRAAVVVAAVNGAAFAKDAASPRKEHALPDLPFGITSFGAALVDQQVYVCAGQRGGAHNYYLEGMSDQFLRLNLRSVTSMSEMLSPAERTAIGEAFGGPVIDLFVSTEGLVGRRSASRSPRAVRCRP